MILKDSVSQYLKTSLILLLEFFYFSAADNGPQAQPLDDPLAENAQHPSLGTLQMENGQHTSVDNLQMGSHKNPSIENHQTGNATPSSDEYLQVDAQQDSGGDLQQPPTGIPLQEDLSSTTETQIMSRKMEVPNNKVCLSVTMGLSYMLLSILFWSFYIITSKCPENHNDNEALRLYILSDILQKKKKALL